jgi:hypothetical protein
MSKGYKKLPNAVGIYKNEVSGNYLARKRINGEEFNKTFTSVVSN